MPDTFKINILLFILLFIFVLLPRAETFAEKEKILTSQRLNYENALKEYQLVSLPYTGWDYILFKLYTSQKIDTFQEPSKIILDPNDYRENAKQYSSTVLPKGYFFVFTNPLRKDDFRCGFDFQGQRIGFFDRCEQRFIESILYGYRITAKPLPIRLSNIMNLSSVWKDIDLLVMYIVPNSPLAKIIETQALALLDLSSMSMERLTISYPELVLEEVPKDNLFQQNNRIITPNQGSMYLVSMSQLLVDLSKSSSTTEGFITRLEMSPEFYDPSYKCINEETTVSKKSCESPYDIYGEPKRIPTFVDKPCTENIECPFYKANKNYENEYGGCQKDGTCEMPLGIVRMGYTKYFDRDPYQPFCYQCKNPMDKSCCEDQKRLVELNELYPTAQPYTYLKSPDYAFANDTQLRTEANLPTSISVKIDTLR